jgi:hypothetical protein
MKIMRNHLNGFVLLAVFVAGLAPAAAQQGTGRDRFPFSIMTPDPGERRAAPPQREATPPVREARKVKRPVRRGSSSFVTIPTHRSPLTPLGTAPTVGTVQPLGQPGSPAQVVPGIRSNTGITMTPPRPPNQGFQDRAANCVQSGAAGGVGAGQIGAYTRSCVNQ